MSFEIPHLLVNQLDGLFACTPSGLPKDGMTRIMPNPDPCHQAARELLRTYTAGGTFDFEAECVKRGVDVEGVAALTAPAIKVWAEIEKYFTQRQAGWKVRAITDRFRLTGTADVLSPIGNNGAIFVQWLLDAQQPYRHQLAGIAWSAWYKLGCPQDGEVKAVAAFLKGGYYRVMTYKPAELQRWHDELIELVLPRTDYAIGRQCERCPLFAACPARHNVALMAADLMLASTPAKAVAMLSALDPANKGEPEVTDAIEGLIFNGRLLSHVLSNVYELLSTAAARVGPIPLRSGLHLAVRATERQTVDPVKGWPVLRRHLPDAEILEAARFSMPRLLATKAGSYNRGERAAARTRMEDDLRAAGAITVTTHRTLEELDLNGEPNDRAINAGGDQPGTIGPEPGPPAGGGEPQVG